MPINIQLPEKIIEIAKIHGKDKRRSVSEQIEHWVKIGRAVEEEYVRKGCSESFKKAKPCESELLDFLNDFDKNEWEW